MRKWNPAAYNQDVALEVREYDLVDLDIHERKSSIGVIINNILQEYNQ